MYNIKYLLLAIFFFPLAVYAQDEKVWSLPQILEQIDKENLALQSYEARSKSFENKADAATAWMPPMVGIGSWQTPYPNQMIMQPGDRGMLMFRAEQEIPGRKKLEAKRDAIAAQGDVVLASRAVTLNGLKATARQQYYNWLVAEEKLSVLRKNQQVLEMMRKIEEVRYPYNQSNLSNVYRAGAAIENNAAMMLMQQGEIARAKGTLNALMNRDGNQDLVIDTTYEVRFLPVLTTDTASLAAARKDVVQMNESIRAMQLDIAAMQQQRRPNFKIQFDHMYPLDAMMPNAFSLMGMVTIPFAPWSAKMYKSEIKAMQWSIKAMETEKSAMLQETQGMVAGMQNELLAMQKKLAAMEKKVLPALQKTFDANYLLYQENTLPLTALLDSWEALNMMQMELLEDKSKLYQMIVEYEKEVYR